MFTLRELVEDWYESGVATWLVLDEAEVHPVAVRAARFVHGWTNLQSIAALDRDPPRIIGGSRHSLCGESSKHSHDHSSAFKHKGSQSQAHALHNNDCDHPKSFGGSSHPICSSCSKRLHDHTAFVGENCLSQTQPTAQDPIANESENDTQESLVVVSNEVASQKAEADNDTSNDPSSFDSGGDGGGSDPSDSNDADDSNSADDDVGSIDGSGDANSDPSHPVADGCKRCKGEADPVPKKPKNPRFVSPETKVSASEWALIMPLFTLYAERECAMRLEASRAMGIEVYGRSVSEIAAEITAMEQDTIPRKSFLEDVMTVGDDLDLDLDLGLDLDLDLNPHCFGGGAWKY